MAKGRTFKNNGITLTETQTDAVWNHDGGDFRGKIIPSHRALVANGLAVICAPSDPRDTYSVHLTETGKAWKRADAGEDEMTALVEQIEVLKAENDLLRQIVTLSEENARIRRKG